jgi:hypothetical protein
MIAKVYTVRDLSFEERRRKGSTKVGTIRISNLICTNVLNVLFRIEVQQPDELTRGALVGDD